MDNISQMIKNMGVMAYIIPAVLIIYVVGIVIWSKKRKQEYDKWLARPSSGKELVGMDMSHLLE